MKSESSENIKKIVFYTSIPRLFRTTLIGYLYEISQFYPVILLSEKLDRETEELVKNKNLFPKIEKIIPVFQHSGKNKNLLFQNRYLFKLAKDIILKYKPNIVVTANDVYPFELYLLRFSKNKGALNICFQGGFQTGTQKEIALMFLLRNVYLMKFPLPLSLKIFLVKFKKYLAHFIYYWILPLLNFQKPFLGKSSFILLEKTTKERDGDYHFVWSERDYRFYVESGFSKEKVFILSHPLRRNYKGFFEKIFPDKNNHSKKVLTLMLSDEKIWFRKKDLALISQKEREENIKEILSLISENLNDWQIFVKPHPAEKDIEREKRIFESISPKIKMAEPSEPADKYIGMSDLIIGIPPASTTLFIASLLNKSKIVLFLNFKRSLPGSGFKNFKGIEYIDSKEKFINILKSIRKNNYYKKSKETEKENIDFLNVIEALEYLWAKKYEKI